MLAVPELGQMNSARPSFTWIVPAEIERIAGWQIQVTFARGREEWKSRQAGSRRIAFGTFAGRQRLRAF